MSSQFVFKHYLVLTELMNSWEYGWGVILMLLTLSFSQSSEEPGAQIWAFHFKRYIDVKEVTGIANEWPWRRFQSGDVSKYLIQKIF